MFELPEEFKSWSTDKKCDYVKKIWPKSCLPKNFILKDIIGSGYEGTVYAVCIDGKCEYALKIEELTSDWQKSVFKKK